MSTQRLNQTQRQTLKFSPLQIQMLNLLQLNTLELEQRIKDELEENPVLEEGQELPETPAEDEAGPSEEEYVPEGNDLPSDDYRDWDEFANDDIPDYKTRSDNYPADEDFYSAPLVQVATWREELKQQIGTLDLDERQRMIAEFIIDSLDDDGFLKYETSSLADDISFTNNLWVEEKEIEQVLPIVRSLDPPGIAARDLQDCLLSQLERRPLTPERQLAEGVVRQCMHELSTRNYEKITRVMGISDNQLRQALGTIAHLNPRPIMGGQTTGQITNENIVPEYVVTQENGQFEISLNNRNLPSVRLSKAMVELARNRIGSKSERTTAQFVRNKLAAARWFIDALRQREQTMLNAMRAIVDLQREYFLSGDVRTLKPMILKDIADKIGMDISTISRVTSGKYAQTPFGLIHLKDLFTEGIRNEDGDEVSNREIQQALVDLIENEDKASPYTDQQIQKLLSEKGYNVARRTVAKYREQLNLPIAKIRREFI